MVCVSGGLSNCERAAGATPMNAKNKAKPMHRVPIRQFEVIFDGSFGLLSRRGAYDKPQRTTGFIFTPDLVRLHFAVRRG